MPSYLVKAECTKETQKRIADTVKPFLDAKKFDGRQDYHCTVIFTRTWTKEPVVIAYETKPIYSVKDVTVFGDAIVLLLDVNSDSFIVQRNQQLTNEIQATSDFPTYTPHVTIGYTKDSIDRKALKEKFVGMLISLDYEVGKLFGS